MDVEVIHEWEGKDGMLYRVVKYPLTHLENPYMIQYELNMDGIKAWHQGTYYTNEGLAQVIAKLAVRNTALEEVIDLAKRPRPENFVECSLRKQNRK